MRDKANDARRQAALARPELRGHPTYIRVSERMPDVDRPVVAYAQDSDGGYRIPFPCAYRGQNEKDRPVWLNLRTETLLEVRVIGWHYPS